MAAIGFLIREEVPVPLPAQPWRSKVNSVHVRLELFAGGDVEDVELIGGKLVSGERIGPRVELGSSAPFGRGLDEIDFLTVARFEPASDQAARIGRPLEHAIGRRGRAVLGQLNLFAGLGDDNDVVVFDRGGPLFIGRTHRGFASKPATPTARLLRLLFAVPGGWFT